MKPPDPLHPPPLPFSYVVREACRQALKLLVAVWVAAYLLHACKSVFGSLPLAIALVAAAQCHLRQRPGAQLTQQRLIQDVAQAATALAAGLWYLLDYCLATIMGAGDGALSWQLPGGPHLAQAGEAASSSLQQRNRSPLPPGSKAESHAPSDQQQQQQSDCSVPGPAHQPYADGRGAAGWAAAAAAPAAREGDRAGSKGVASSGAAAAAARPPPPPPHQREAQQRSTDSRGQHGSQRSRLSYEQPYAPAAPSDHNVWRAQVGSKVVEFAWEKLSGGILQTWVYDVWWALLSPDREFPAEVRRLLNGAFGRLAARARRLDVGAVLVRDLCEALMATLELYRGTLEQLGGEEQLKARALRHAAQNMVMTSPAAAGPHGSASAAAISAARERLLQGGLRASGGLHPAFEEPDGHYRALRDIADALVGFLWPDDQLCCGRLRPLLRELLSACVLRPTMMFASPITINKVLHAALPALPIETPLAPAPGTTSGPTAPPPAAPAAPTASTASSGGGQAARAPNPSPTPTSVRPSTSGAGGPGAAGASSASRGAATSGADASGNCGGGAMGGSRAVAQVPSSLFASSLPRHAGGAAAAAAVVGGGTEAAKRSGSAGSAAAAAADDAADRRAAPPTSTEVAARAAAECGQEFERRAAANAAAEGALLRRLAGGRSSSSDSNSNDYAQQHQQHRGRHSTSRRPHRPPPQPLVAGPHQPPLATHHDQDGQQVSEPGSSVRKSMSTVELYTRTNTTTSTTAITTTTTAADTPGGGASPADAAAGAPGTPPSGERPSASGPPVPRGLSASYHSGMDHPHPHPHPEPQPPAQSHSHPRAGHQHQLRGGHLSQTRLVGGGGGGSRGSGNLVGASADVSPERDGPGRRSGDGARQGIHRRSCSYDTAAARGGTGSGTSGSGGVGGRGGGGGGGGGAPFSLRGSWFDFDFTSGLSLSRRPEPQDGQQQHRQQQQPLKQQQQQVQQRHEQAQYQEQQQQPQGNPHQQQQEQRGDATWQPWRASVAAFEMVSEPLGFGLTADYVVYKIRVADSASETEWTVARRFRNFEALAAKLASTHPKYRTQVQALPPKRIFIHTADVAFVNSRRAELDAYLQQLLAVAELAACTELQDFLLPDALQSTAASSSSSGAARRSTSAPFGGSPQRQHRASSSTGPEAAQQQQPSVGPAAAARNLFERMTLDLQRGLRQKDRRAGACAASPAQPAAAGASAATKGGSGLAWLGRGRSAAQVGDTLPAGRARSEAAAQQLADTQLDGEEFDELMTDGEVVGLDEQDTEAESASSGAPPPPPAAGGFRLGLPTWGLPPARARQSQHAEGGDAGGLDVGERARTAAALPSEAGSQQPISSGGSGYASGASRLMATLRLQGGAGGSFSSTGALPLTPAAHSPVAPNGAATAATAAAAPSAEPAAANGDATRLPTSALPLRPSIDVQHSPTPDMVSEPGVVSTAAAAGQTSSVSAGSVPRERRSRAGPSGPVPRIVSVPSTPIAAPGGVSAIGGMGEGLPSLQGVAAADGSVAGGSAAAAAAAAAAGVSAPLYELVDVLFGLQGQGFFRRQVIAVTRQMLSLLAGDAIDTYVTHQLRHLTSEHSVARALLLLHGALFPGGAWYSFGLPPQPPQPQPPQPRPPQYSARSAGSGSPGEGSGAAFVAAVAPAPAVPRWRPSPPISAELYLEPAVVPADADQVAERVRARLFDRAPAMLVNVVGARGYARVLSDVWGVMQSRTLVLQLAYTLLQTLLVRLFPELQPRLQHLQPRGLRRAAEAAQQQ